MKLPDNSADVYYLLLHAAFCAMCNWELETFLQCICARWNINYIFLQIYIRFRFDKRMIIYLLIHKYIYMIFASSNTVLLSNRLFSSDISKTKGVPCHWSYDGFHMQSVCIDRKACEFLFHSLQSIIDRTVCDNVCQTCGKLVVFARYLLCQYNW